MNHPIVTDDETMELLAYLYGYMGEEEKATWSPKDAQEMMDDQRRYEIEQGLEPKEYDVADVYEVIRQFIQPDAEDEA